MCIIEEHKLRHVRGISEERTPYPPPLPAYATAGMVVVGNDKRHRLVASPCRHGTPYVMLSTSGFRSYWRSRTQKEGEARAVNRNNKARACVYLQSTGGTSPIPRSSLSLPNAILDVPLQHRRLFHPDGAQVCGTAAVGDVKFIVASSDSL